MTGKELILYILNNDLENEEIFVDGHLIGFIDEEEAAEKFGVGISTIKAWHTLGMMRGLQIGDTLYFPKDAVVVPIL